MHAVRNTRVGTAGTLWRGGVVAGRIVNRPLSRRPGYSRSKRAHRVRVDPCRNSVSTICENSTAERARVPGSRSTALPQNLPPGDPEAKRIKPFSF